MISLDLGCGQAKQPDTIGVDMVTLVAGRYRGQSLEVSAAVRRRQRRQHLSQRRHRAHPAIPFRSWRSCIASVATARAFISAWSTGTRSICRWIRPTCVAFHENTFDFFGGRKGRNYYTHARFEVVKVVKAWDLFWKKVTFGREKVPELPGAPSQQCADRPQFRTEGAEDRSRTACERSTTSSTSCAVPIASRASTGRKGERSRPAGAAQRSLARLRRAGLRAKISDL